MEFESKLRGLLSGYGDNLRDVISLLDPTAGNGGKFVPLATQEKSTRRARSLMVYKNPHSGEIVETKGGVKSC